MMKKCVSFLLTVLCLLFVLAGCAAQPTQSVASDTKRTVVDMSGRTVEVPEEVNSYIALWVGTVDIVLMMDRGEHMVGCSQTAASYSMFDQACHNDGTITYFSSDAVTVEEILETGAQVVFYRGADDADLADKLIDAGVAAIDVEFNTYDEMFKAIEIMADVFNTDFAHEITERYLSYAKETIENAQAIGESVQDRKTVLVIRDTSDLRAYGVNRFAGRWVNLCGGEYALKEGDPDGYVNLTGEQLMECDPEFIVFVIPGEAKKFREDPRWASLTAVQKGHVYENPSCIGTWSNHGVECVLQFQWAIEKLYPELADFSISDEVRDFYATYYDLELTEEEVNGIINAA